MMEGLVTALLSCALGMSVVAWKRAILLWYQVGWVVAEQTFAGIEV